jgi:class 3 adenylate cyclase
MADGGSIPESDGRYPNVEVVKTFEVALPQERVWEVVADTQHVNALLYRTPEVEVRERGTLRSKLAGGPLGFLGPEYDEYPWEFEAPHRFRSVRVITRGIVKRTDVGARLEATEGGTKVEYTGIMETAAGPFGWVARVGFVLATNRAVAELEKLLQSLPPEGPVLWPQANPEAANVFARARAFADDLRQAHPEQTAAIDLLVNHIATAADMDVSHMRPYELAERLMVGREESLELCLRATRAGLLRLSWDLLCPSCENPPAGFDKLKDLPSGQMHCPACDVLFDSDFESNVECTFHPSPAVRATTDAIFCYGSPARTPSWVAQFVVEPHSERGFESDLGAGRYRVQAAGVDGRTLLDVGKAGEAACEIALVPSAEGARPSLPSTTLALQTGRVRVSVRNDDDEARRVQIAHRRFASNSATAADVTALGAFRDLFTEDVLAPDQHVRVGRTAILFTDLVGSTAMYERIGDAAAYGLVRRHFLVMEAAIDEHGGRIIKTIGDAVMASFPRAEDAVRAAWQSIPLVRDLAAADGSPAGLGLKVGVHVGHCLAVEANQMSDYFGRTVNIAARVQSIAGGDELVLSDEAIRSPGVARFVAEMRAGGHAVRNDSQPVKGIDKPLELTRIQYVVDAKPVMGPASAPEAGQLITEQVPAGPATAPEADDLVTEQVPAPSPDGE